MKLSLFVLGVFAAVACAERPAAAQDYPWCVYYDFGGGGGGGATNCGFSTFQQCLAARTGSSDSCGANPMYRPPPGPYPFTGYPRRHRY
jgi:hypothetical protein